LAMMSSTVCPAAGKLKSAAAAASIASLFFMVSPLQAVWSSEDTKGLGFLFHRWEHTQRVTEVPNYIPRPDECQCSENVGRGVI
jgi:hypothetical protein